MSLLKDRLNDATQDDNKEQESIDENDETKGDDEEEETKEDDIKHNNDEEGSIIKSNVDWHNHGIIDELSSLDLANYRQWNIHKI